MHRAQPGRMQKLRGSRKLLTPSHAHATTPQPSTSSHLDSCSSHTHDDDLIRRGEVYHDCHNPSENGWFAATRPRRRSEHGLRQITTCPSQPVSSRPRAQLSAAWEACHASTPGETLCSLNITPQHTTSNPPASQPLSRWKHENSASSPASQSSTQVAATGIISGQDRPQSASETSVDTGRHSSRRLPPTVSFSWSPLLCLRLRQATRKSTAWSVMVLEREDTTSSARSVNG